MIKCIICKKVISYNGESISYDLCRCCCYDDLTEEQKSILMLRKAELGKPRK